MLLSLLVHILFTFKSGTGYMIIVIRILYWLHDNFVEDFKALLDTTMLNTEISIDLQQGARKYMLDHKLSSFNGLPQ